eukprot:353280_1
MLSSIKNIEAMKMNLSELICGELDHNIYGYSPDTEGNQGTYWDQNFYQIKMNDEQDPETLCAQLCYNANDEMKYGLLDNCARWSVSQTHPSGQHCLLQSETAYSDVCTNCGIMDTRDTPSYSIANHYKDFCNTNLFYYMLPSPSGTPDTDHCDDAFGGWKAFLDEYPELEA